MDNWVGENPPLVDHVLQGQGFGNLWTQIDGLQRGYVENLSLALWNPATREVRPLPAHKFLLDPSIGVQFRPLGVWFHIVHSLICFKIPPSVTKFTGVFINMATSLKDALTFPEDLAMEIIQRLPVKPLSLFKCIRKNSYTVIDSLGFIGKTFDYNGNNKNPKFRGGSRIRRLRVPYRLG